MIRLSGLHNDSPEKIQNKKTKRVNHFDYKAYNLYYGNESL